VQVIFQLFFELTGKPFPVIYVFLFYLEGKEEKERQR